MSIHTKQVTLKRSKWLFLLRLRWVCRRALSKLGGMARITSHISKRLLYPWLWANTHQNWKTVSVLASPSRTDNNWSLSERWSCNGKTEQYTEPPTFCLQHKLGSSRKKRPPPPPKLTPGVLLLFGAWLLALHHLPTLAHLISCKLCLVSNTWQEDPAQSNTAVGNHSIFHSLPVGIGLGYWH